VKKTLFATPQDAEAAFYEALVKRDLEAMMEVWADDDDSYCVHPGGVRVSGVERIRESWRRIFASGQDLRFSLRDQPMIATNVYQRTERGWRMVAHHAAAAPASVKADAPDEPAAKTLH